MNDVELLERLSATNAYGAESDVPESIWTRTLALREIERRSGMTQTTKQPKPVQPRERRRQGWLVAAAVFAVIVVIGGAVLLASNQAKDNPVTDEPTSSTTTTEATTTTGASTTTTAETAPGESLGDSFFVGSLPAGTYVAPRFPVPMVFEFDEGWNALGEDPLGGLLLSTSEMACTADCGPVEGFGVVIRQLEGSPDDLAADYVASLGAEGTITAGHLVASEVMSGTYAGHDAVTVRYTIDDGLEFGVTVPVLWPYSSEQSGIKPLVFAGENVTIFVDMGVGPTIVVHLPHAAVDGAAAFAAAVEDLMATRVSFVTE